MQCVTLSVAYVWISWAANVWSAARGAGHLAECTVLQLLQHMLGGWHARKASRWRRQQRPQYLAAPCTAPKHRQHATGDCAHRSSTERGTAPAAACQQLHPSRHQRRLSESKPALPPKVKASVAPQRQSLSWLDGCQRASMHPTDEARALTLWIPEGRTSC